MDYCAGPYALEPEYTEEELAAAEVTEADQRHEPENISAQGPS